MSDTSYCRSKFKIICNPIVIWAHLKIYFSAFTNVICHFRISIVKYTNAYSLLVSKSSARRGSLALGSYEKTLAQRKKKVRLTRSLIARQAYSLIVGILLARYV
jgi:hypothetical protein